MHTLQSHLRSKPALAGEVYCVICYIRRIKLMNKVPYVRFIFLEEALDEVILPALEAKHVRRSRCNL